VTTRGDFGTLNRLKQNLRALPVSLAHDVARRAAPAMTGLATGAYNSGRTVYDAPRPLGVEGNRLSLHRTGATEGTLRFVANGRIVRCVLGTRYAKYLIGKYGVLPMGRIPARWQARLVDLVSEARVTL
jgi:hypothetical protein